MDANPQSIDAVLGGSASNVLDGHRDTIAFPPLSPSTPNHPSDVRTKYRTRDRFFQGLQRISSTPSLKMRPRPYRGSSRASLSCASLSSASTGPYQVGSFMSSESEFSQQYSTAPSSAAPSPGPSTPFNELRPRARTLSQTFPSSVGLPSSVRPASPMSDGTIAEEDYFSCNEALVEYEPKLTRRSFDMFAKMPAEIRIQVLSCLKPWEIVRCSAVSKDWHKYCYDGQLWKQLDTNDYYQHIPGPALVKIIKNAGPFIRDLNLRGCVQLRDRWSDSFVKACLNLNNISLEGCQIERQPIHMFFSRNSNLVHINLCGVKTVNNLTMQTIGLDCPKLEQLNITWCEDVTTQGLRLVVDGCRKLRDLRAGEVRGWDDLEFAAVLHCRNQLEKLVLTSCDDLSNDFLATLLLGPEEGREVDFLTGRVICKPRKLKHLDLTHCRRVDDSSVKYLAHNVPSLEGLQLSKCRHISASTLINIIPTVPRLTHLDLEEVDSVDNDVLTTLASSPCAPHLTHLVVSYCELISDSGMVPIIKTCRSLARIDMDNTRVSDLVLVEAAAVNRERNRRAALDCSSTVKKPGVFVGLRLVVFDCPLVTWMGVREVLSRNTDLARPPLGPVFEQYAQPTVAGSMVDAMASSSHTSKSAATVTVTTKPMTTHHLRRHSITPPTPPLYHHTTIALKAFYTWQPTINEHAKRVLASEFPRARRLEKKWAEFMMCGEEAAGGGRRRRRRLREAMDAMAEGEDEASQEALGVAVRGVGRRRARSAPLGPAGTGCVVM